MVEIVFWIFVGMMIGWCAMPQPVWAKPLYDKVVSLTRIALTKFVKNTDGTQR